MFMHHKGSIYKDWIMKKVSLTETTTKCAWQTDYQRDRQTQKDNSPTITTDSTNYRYYKNTMNKHLIHTEPNQSYCCETKLWINVNCAESLWEPHVNQPGASKTSDMS